MQGRAYLRMLVAMAGILIPPIIGTAVAQSGPQLEIVQVDGGKVKGVQTDVAGVQLFKGIPFAGSTADPNRFSPPQPVKPWDGVKLADRWGDQVLQDVHANPVGTFWGNEFYFDPAYIPAASENGLNLNVWTPAHSANDHLPVYVWIHGGGNNHGNASEMEFYASKLAAKGIVVVAVQYRTGIFGWLSLSDLSRENANHVSGNYGTRDLIKALHWVHDYIGNFGGDPSLVTIGGQSAGASNSMMLLRSPLARALFKRAVIESGFVGLFTPPMASLPERESMNADAIATAFGRPMTLKALRAIPAEEFVTTKAADGTMLLYDALHQAATKPSAYTLDGYVFTKDSIDLLKPGALDGYDILIGGTSNEYSSLMGGPDKTMSPGEFAAGMEKLGLGPDWKEVYRPSDDREAYRMWLKAQSDFNLQRYLVSAEIAKARNPSVNIYAYYFNHAPPGRDSEFYGSYHSSDLWYFFDSLRNVAGQRNWTSADHRMAETMSTYLANFIKTGNPNGNGLPQWPQTSKDSNNAFLRFADGYAYPVSQTPYPDRDLVNRKAVVQLNESAGFTQR